MPDDFPEQAMERELQQIHNDQLSLAHLHRERLRLLSLGSLSSLCMVGAALMGRSTIVFIMIAAYVAIVGYFIWQNFTHILYLTRIIRTCQRHLATIEKSTKPVSQDDEVEPLLEVYLPRTHCTWESDPVLNAAVSLMEGIGYELEPEEIGKHT